MNIDNTSNFTYRPIELIEANLPIFVQIELFKQDLYLAFSQTLINFENQPGKLLEFKSICLCLVLDSVKLVDISLFLVQLPLQLCNQKECRLSFFLVLHVNRLFFYFSQVQRLHSYPNLLYILRHPVSIYNFVIRISLPKHASKQKIYLTISQRRVNQFNECGKIYIPK